MDTGIGIDLIICGITEYKQSLNVIRKHPFENEYIHKGNINETNGQIELHLWPTSAVIIQFPSISITILRGQDVQSQK